MKWALSLLVVVVLALHHDYWNWENKTLIFGFLPIGLVYHACYAVVAAILMAVLVRFAWPAHLEEIEERAERAEEPA